MEYEVTTTAGTMVIKAANSGLQVRIDQQATAETKAQTAFAIATLYEIKGGFIPVSVYVFTAIDLNGKDLPEASLEQLKALMDCFFLTILGTDLYVKEIPKTSTLFAEESIRLYGNTPAAA